MHESCASSHGIVDAFGSHQTLRMSIKHYCRCTSYGTSAMLLNFLPGRFAYETCSLLIYICIRLHNLETKGLVWLPLILPDQSVDPSPRPSCCTIDACSPGDGQKDYCCGRAEWDLPLELDPLGLAIPQQDKHERYVVMIDDGASVSSYLADEVCLRNR